MMADVDICIYSRIYNFLVCKIYRLMDSFIPVIFNQSVLIDLFSILYADYSVDTYLEMRGSYDDKIHLYNILI